jgi:hypothetical protein
MTSKLDIIDDIRCSVIELASSPKFFVALDVSGHGTSFTQNAGNLLRGKIENCQGRQAFVLEHPLGAVSRRTP